MDEQVPIIPPGDIPVPQIPPTIHKSDWAPLIIATTLLFILVVFTLSRFGNIRSQPWYVTVVCTIGWFFPFWIVFLLPLDLASVSESKKKVDDVSFNLIIDCSRRQKRKSAVCIRFPVFFVCRLESYLLDILLLNMVYCQYLPYCEQFSKLVYKDDDSDDASLCKHWRLYYCKTFKVCSQCESSILLNLCCSRNFRIDISNFWKWINHKVYTKKK